MTKWSEMTPRERDALVAEKVMGFVLTGDGFVHSPSGALRLQSYTTNISAAWEVASRWKGFLEIRKWEDDEWECMLLDEEHDPVCNRFADTAPEAICLAALRAVGVDI